MSIETYPELTQSLADAPAELPADLLTGRTLLITGAGDGIGACLAKAAACFGANVVLLGRTRSKLEAVFDWIAAHTATQPVIVPCDLLNLDTDAVAALAEQIEATYGALHGIVHNASMLGPKVPLAHYPADAWHNTMQVNVNAPFLLTQGLFALLDTADEACVLFISSTVGREGRAYWGAYSASKFALEGLNQILADETETAGRIKTYSVNPGGTRTAMRRAAYPMEDPASVPPPETHMWLLLYLLGGSRHGLTLPPTGSQVDARTYQLES